MKPILFNTEMVRAILNGHKTVTRRDPFQIPETFSFMKLKGMEYKCKNTYKSEDYKWKNEKVLTAVFENDVGINYIVPCRYTPDDILYVRETWYYESHMEDITAGKPDLQSGRYTQRYIFKADCPEYPVNIGVGRHGWRPSIHMPREAARIFLRVTDVRVEKLQDMRLSDCLAEGVRLSTTEKSDCVLAPHRARMRYAVVWNSTLKPADLALYGWSTNPWVRVIEFKKINKAEAIANDKKKSC